MKNLILIFTNSPAFWLRCLIIVETVFREKIQKWDIWQFSTHEGLLYQTCLEEKLPWKLRKARERGIYFRSGFNSMKLNTVVSRHEIPWKLCLQTFWKANKCFGEIVLIYSLKLDQLCTPSVEHWQNPGFPQKYTRKCYYILSFIILHKSYKYKSIVMPENIFCFVSNHWSMCWIFMSLEKHWRITL